jgi:hypothetical protein
VVEQGLLVLQQPVEAAIEGVLLDQGEVRAEQVRHGAGLEPVPVQAPLAARIDQAVAHQGLQDLVPGRALARGRQAGRKEAVQPQLPIELAGQPAGAPLARSVQLHLAQMHLDAVIRRMVGYGPIGREQGQLAGLAGLLVEALDHPAPGFTLTVVDLAQIKNLALHDPAARATLALNNAPVAVLLAVLDALV